MDIHVASQAATISVPSDALNISVAGQKASASAASAAVNIAAQNQSYTVNTGEQIATHYEQREPYEGSYIITPRDETQVLATNHKRMTADVVINPIPSNYGEITYNGAVLTVS